LDANGTTRLSATALALTHDAMICSTSFRARLGGSSVLELQMNSQTASNVASSGRLNARRGRWTKSLSGWVKFTRLNKLKMSALNSKESVSFHYLGEFCIDISETRASKGISAHIALLSESRDRERGGRCKAGKKIAPLAVCMAASGRRVREIVTITVGVESPLPGCNQRRFRSSP